MPWMIQVGPVTGSMRWGVADYCGDASVEDVDEVAAAVVRVFLSPGAVDSGDGASVTGEALKVLLFKGSTPSGLTLFSVLRERRNGM